MINDVYNLMCGKAFKDIGLPDSSEMMLCHSCKMENDCPWQRSNECRHYELDKHFSYEYSQEELQDMVMEKNGYTEHGLMTIFMNDYAEDYMHGSKTITEMWLRFAMWIIHDKYWSEEKEDWK